MIAGTALGALLEDTPGLVGAVLGTRDGELRVVTGDVANGDSVAATVAVVTAELAAIGASLGLGELAVASLKSPRAGRLFARRGDAVLAIEVDPKRPLGGLEVKLRDTAWQPDDELLSGPVVNRVPTVPSAGHVSGSTLPPPVAASAAPLASPSIAAVLPPPPPGLPAGPRPPRSPTPSGPSRPSTRGQRRTAPAITSSLLRVMSPNPTRPPTPTSMLLPASPSGQLFAGDLEEFSLPDLLEFLRNSHRTGLLVCSTAAGTGAVQLSHGMVISADSPRALDLREHFLARPELLPEQRRLLAALPPECFAETMVVEELTSRDLVPRDEVERARVARIYSAFREMVGWTSGRFSFDPAAVITANPALALSAQSILMQIYQEQDESNR